MNSSSCVAATLSPSKRQELALQVLTKTEPITSLAKEHQVSRKFLYQQSNKANDALEAAFAPSNNNDDDVLFHLPITKAWLFQLILDDNQGWRTIVMTGQKHPHWLELLGFKLFKRA